MEYLVIWLLFGGAAAWIMGERGNSGCGGFALGMLLGPIGILIAILIPKSHDKRIEEIRREESLRDQASRMASPCQHCGAPLAPTAKYCSACGKAREVKPDK